MTKRNFYHVSHIKSKLTREVLPEEFYGLTPMADNSDASGSSPIKINIAKRPAPDNIVEGEIAVNYKKGHELLTIKNDEGEIVGFINENEFNQSQEIIARAMSNEKDERISDISKLKSEIDELSDRIDIIDPETDSKIDELRNYVEEIDGRVEQNTYDITQKLDKSVFNALKSDVDDMELTVSASLNDLNSRIIANKSVADAKFVQIDSALDSIDSDLDGVINDVEYDEVNKNIVFKNGDDVIAEIDATAFIKDGMVSEVEISQGNLIITFNTDAGKEPISIPITDIFNPSNYYDKTAVDGLLSAKADESDIYGKDTIDEMLALKADKSDVYAKSEIDSKLSDYATKDEVSDMELTISASLNDLNSRIIANSAGLTELNSKVDAIVIPDVSGFAVKTDVDEALELKADKTELEPLAKAADVTSEIAAAVEPLATKQDVGAVDEKVDTNISEISTIKDTLANINELIEDNELIISSSLNDLNSRILTNNTIIQNLLSENSTLRQTVQELTQSLSELTARVEALENNNN